MKRPRGRPAKTPDELYVFKTIRFPPDLWRELEEAVPQGERSAVVQEGLRRELRRRHRQVRPAARGEGEQQE